MIRNLRKRKAAELRYRRDAGERAVRWFLMGLVDAVQGATSSARTSLAAARICAHITTAGVLQ